MTVRRRRRRPQRRTAPPADTARRTTRPDETRGECASLTPCTDTGDVQLLHADRGSCGCTPASRRHFVQPRATTHRRHPLHAHDCERMESTRRDGPSPSSNHPRCRLARMLRLRLPAAAMMLLMSLLLLVQVSPSSGSAYSTSVVTTTPNVSLSFFTADSGDFFLNNVALEYSLLRPDVTITTTNFDPDGTSAGSLVAWQSLVAGNADAAFILFSPTAAQKTAQPDFIYQPLWAAAGTAVYNLPDLTDYLILSPTVLGRIYMGNITTWNHTELVALNPNVTLPNEPIHILLQTERVTLSAQFTYVTGVIFPEFAEAIPSSYLPDWPTEKYASYEYVTGLDGPSIGALATPYSIGVSYVSAAEKLGATSASFVNLYGATVRPTYTTVSSGLNERVVLSSVNSTGGISYEYNTAVDMAYGPTAFPYILAFTVALPQTFSRQTCRAKSELVKFIRWMLNADNIRYSMCISEYVALFSDEAESQLGVVDALIALECGGTTIASGTLDPIAVNGAGPTTTHITARTLLLESYSISDTVMTYEYTTMDEGVAITEVGEAGSATDMVWYVPMTFDAMYPGYTAEYIDSGTLQLLHVSLFGVVPQFNLPSTVLSAIEVGGTNGTTALPLVLDMETLAQIFLGDITSWLDDRMVKRNPVLTAAYGTISSNITLVLCGTGLASEKKDTAIGNHLILRLNKTDAFQSSGLTWTLPVDWTQITAKLDLLGVTYILVDSEPLMEATIARIPGAIGYICGFENSSTSTTDFSLVREAVTPSGDLEEFIVEPTPINWLNAATASTPTTDTGFAMAAALSTEYAHRTTWPLLLMMSLALPTDLSTSNSLGLSASTLCFRQTKAANFALWLATNESITAPSFQTGRATISQLDAWATFNTEVLYECSCSGTSILYVAPVYWKMSSAVKMFGRVVGGIGLTFLVFIAAMVIKFRNRSIIRVADVRLQLEVLLGAAMVLTAAILYTFTPTKATCNAISWLLIGGLAFIISIICIKVIRVYHVHSQRRSMRLKKLTGRVMRLLVLAWCSVQAILLILAQVDGGMLTVESPSTIESSVTHYYAQCSASGTRTTVYSSLAILLDAALIAVTSVLAFGVRHVSSAFNESRNISWAIWNTAISTVICVPLMLLTGGMEGDTGVFLMLFLVCWITICTIAFTFGYKVWMLLAEEIEAVRNQRAEASRSWNASSKGSSRLSLNGHSNSDSGSSSVFNLPSLEGTSIATLEKYITAVETHIRLTRGRRKEVFGTESAVPSSIVGDGNWNAARSLTRAVFATGEPQVESSVLENPNSKSPHAASLLRRAVTSLRQSPPGPTGLRSPVSPVSPDEIGASNTKPPLRPTLAVPQSATAVRRQSLRMHMARVVRENTVMTHSGSQQPTSAPSSPTTTALQHSPTPTMAITLTTPPIDALRGRTMPVITLGESITAVGNESPIGASPCGDESPE